MLRDRERVSGRKFELHRGPLSPSDGKVLWYGGQADRRSGICGVAEVVRGETGDVEGTRVDPAEVRHSQM